MTDIKSYIPGGILIAVIVGLVFFAYDLLFSKPTHLQGRIIEKIFVPARTVSEATPYGGARRSNYFITIQKEEQWIAIVKMENGDTLSIHCMRKHYHTKNVGDVIHFKKYEGEHFHIKYFAHNEEED